MATTQANSSAQRGFDVVFRELEAARLTDEQLHRRHGSVDDLITSRDRLHSLRAELAGIRAAIGTDE